MSMTFEVLVRRYIENLAPGVRIDLGDMHHWAATRFRYSPKMIAFCCMSVCHEMEDYGYLVRADPDTSGYEPQDYSRTDKARPAKLTAAVQRRAEMKFRQFVMALPPRSQIEWFDMDFWVFVNFRAFDTSYSELTIVCMTASQSLEKEGWLAFLGFDSEGRGVPDYYYRTDKTES
jgi:hypothetical protein